MEYLKHFSIPQEHDLTDPFTIKSISATVADMTDNAVYNAIIRSAQESGVTDLYLMDKKFVADALREKLDREKGCEYCTGHVKTFPTHCDGEAYITKLTPLPAIDLMTGEMADTADPPFFAIRITSDEMGEDFVPIRLCPYCGRELKEDTHGK